LVNLPDSFITTIENLIKKERPEIVVLDEENQSTFDPGNDFFGADVVLN
jgi:hypothetical protein